jgi:hypothetical protein
MVPNTEVALNGAADQVRLPVDTGAPHVKLVPTGIRLLPTPVVGVTVKVFSLQITAVILVIRAIGSNVTVTLNCAPLQDPGEVGVTM